ncbi:class I SAM-dependent methyltransferase [Marivirga sp.]|uniref:class I SAM-dependent methyltransferase n=1 Tax=Marivirga sp. TaxID=2018662 RepID=UPI002D7E91DD|nr:class I SAM-dependent methyltransferase [Marivirga sp.]HET8861191.1 class I SAM-dependent methyltransferase [Marivirga sp.]
MSKYFLPNDDIEIDRYTTHNNDVNDPRYRTFVSPITNGILKHFGGIHHGLDFGSGTGPVITVVLREKGYSIDSYDPYFDNRPKVLKETYHYIACCEVVEHFHDPSLEFQRLKKLLKPNGKLFIMTDLYHEDIIFENWYYKNDPTHVFFYQESTFECIKKKFGFKSVEITGRLITFSL